MTRQLDLEQRLDAWLDEGPTDAAAAVFDATVARIYRQRQRSAWRLRPWRFPIMSTPIKLVAVGAALLVVILGGAVFMGGGAGPDLPAPTVTPAPSASPSPAIVCEDDLPGCAGPLAAGTHESNRLEPRLTYVTPDGWRNVIDMATLYKLDPPSGSPYILLWSDASIVLQDESCSATPDPTKGRRAADWIAALTSHPGLVASTPVSVGMGGNSPAQQVELALDPAWTATCPRHEGPYVSFLSQSIRGEAGEYGLGGTERVLVTVIDIGRRTVVGLTYGPAVHETFVSSTQAARSIVASFRFSCTINDGPCGS